MTQSLTRRRFVTGSAMALAGLALGCTRRSDAASALPGKVSIVEFDDAGKRLRTVTVPTVVKTDAQWRKQLPPLSYQVTRHAGTERAYTGALLEEHRKGVFRCLCCDTALYDSATKFESGTGWPSFTQPASPDVVAYTGDESYGMVRIEATCSVCDAHLGHVFPDGPAPSGLRYCMNAVSLEKLPHND